MHTNLLDFPQLFKGTIFIKRHAFRDLKFEPYWFQSCFLKDAANIIQQMGMPELSHREVN
ncbi:hypothetical protein D3C76_1664280 [compost metagenome]